ncbi:hypothetical protein [Adhaeretor mobilis]|uniref:Uncharacterized protein n=1 Tax=Adhaeretor mobilis TaxID=1930276 RepID=A0A517MWH8_9BACT|nr:hypothetical protein [Adhaeretor mobilis]QDS99228.1 hypothetical protein HG15A2_25200 [Adhaeretor mobilis]
MKLHLRVLKLRGTSYRLVTLRPHSEVAYSTNYFHDTWHIVSDQYGAKLLARLLWGLSFQRISGTAILIHGEHIKPTPFGAEPSDPILITNSNLTKIDAKSLTTLRGQLKYLGPSQCTLRWHTFGLDAALERERESGPYNSAIENTEQDWVHYQENKRLWLEENMCRCGGFVCYSAPPEILRLRAQTIAQMDPASYGMVYYYMADRNCYRWPDGEVQIFSDYKERRLAASEARRQVLAEKHSFSDPDSLYAVVAARRDGILTRRRSARRCRKQP